MVCGEGALLVGVSLVVQGFFLSGGRKCVYLEVFMVASKDLMWALVKPEKLILKLLKDKGRLLG